MRRGLGEGIEDASLFLWVKKKKEKKNKEATAGELKEHQAARAKKARASERAGGRASERESGRRPAGRFLSVAQRSPWIHDGSAFRWKGGGLFSDVLFKDAWG